MTPLKKSFKRMKFYVKKLKLNIYVLYLAYRDPGVPWYAKLFAISVVAYAFSPIDLIPDFIPILGYLDDLIFVPLGIIIALKLIPPRILEQYRGEAEEIREKGEPRNWITGALFIAIWIIFFVWASLFLYRVWKYH